MINIKFILLLFVLVYFAVFYNSCGLSLYFFLRCLNITIAFCTNGKRDGDSDHSDGSPSKRKRLSDNEETNSETNVNLTSDPVMLQDETQNAPNITSQNTNITLEDVANTSGIFLPLKKKTMAENLEQNVSVSTSTLNKIDKSSTSEPFQQKEIQIENNSLEVQELKEEDIKNILGIDYNEFKELAKNYATSVIENSATATSMVSTLAESAFVSSTVQTWINKAGLPTKVGKFLGAGAAATVLLTNDSIKDFVKNFCHYQIDLICSRTPQDPMNRPPSPPNQDQFAGDVPLASSNIELQHTVVDTSQQSTRNEMQQDPSDNIMIPSVFEDTYLNTNFLFDLGVQVTVFLLISIVANENKVAIYKWIQGISKKISKYSNFLSIFIFNLVDNFIFFHPIWVRVFCCIIIIIIFTLLR
jgi:LAS superfamily LD-carboxypeptidase LdcB